MSAENFTAAPSAASSSGLADGSLANAASTEAGHQPYVPDSTHMPEFTWSALVVGAILGIIFGASSLYLVLKVGMTVSASIPVAVLSITLFRIFAKVFGVRRATILENNIVQTTGSAGESIAFGVGVTMPALMLLGFEMSVGRVMVVSVLGGLLGILMMVPLRRAFIVKQHGSLKYPEGTACADVLIVGEQGGSSAKTVFVGFGIAFIYQFLWQGLKWWKESPAKTLSWFKGAVPAIEVNPTLLGVGYIIGTRISCVMVGGGILASFVLIPVIRLFGDGLSEPLYPGTKLISKMDEEDIWKNYVLYIGAGAVAAGGIISLFQALPLIISSIKSGLQDIRSFGGQDSNGIGRPRTDHDLPIWMVGVGTLGLVAAIWLTTPLHQEIDWIPDLQMNPLGAGLIVLFGFLFVTVSSRLTGEIGSSSNPISGMTVATLLLTCLIFLVLGWTHRADMLTALSIAGVVCIAASNGGTTSQDLKTGYLVGATPSWQQLAILVGSLSSALVIGWILIVLNEAGTVYTAKNLPTPKTAIHVADLKDTAQAPNDPKVYHVWRATEGNEQEVPPGKYLVDDGGAIRYLVDPGINGNVSRRDDGSEAQKFKAPKARLMSFITEGILGDKLPWTLVLLGVSIAVVLELCGIPSLPFAVGVYLPLSSSTPILAGGLVRYVADKWGRTDTGAARTETESDMSPGVLLSTGYIAGGAIAGVLIAFLSFSDEIPKVLGTWQYRTTDVQVEQPLRTLAIELAVNEAGAAAPIPRTDDKTAAPIFVDLPELALPPTANIVWVVKGKKEEVERLASEIEELNAELLTRYAPVKKGTVLKLPREETYTVETDTTLGDLSARLLGSRDKAPLLLDLNEETVKPAEKLPVGATLKIPQQNAPALVAFGFLCAFLLLVGLGWALKSPPAGHGTLQGAPDTAPKADDEPNPYAV